MTPEELFAALAKKKIDSFHTSVLGFTIGSLIDRGVTEDEARALCDLLINKIAVVKNNPEAAASLEKFTSLVETSMAGGR